MAFIRSLHDPDANQEIRLEQLSKARRLKFLLALGATAVSDKEGLSAAGNSPESRRLTPAVDAEALILGYPLSAPSLPVSPEGIVSPVVITRAMLALLKMDSVIFDCGSFSAPKVAHTKIGVTPAQCVSTGKALTASAVKALFEKGVLAGKKYAAENDCLILAECVPGGTTTAMGILTALGHDVRGLVSGSMPVCDHDQRPLLIEAGLKAAEISRQRDSEYAFEVMAALGDPMQPFVVGLVAAASSSCSIVLAGGSQMLAVFALLKNLPEHSLVEIDFASISVITTKWVAFDRFAGTKRLAELVQAPLLAACPDFHQSQYQGLRSYENGHVKEGVGAGASMAIAFLRGFDQQEIVSAIDRSYEEMVLDGLDTV